MDERAVKRLVRFELRRTFPFLRRGVALTAVVALLVGLVRGWGSELLWMLLLGSGLSYAVQVPAQLARDRLGGELHVLGTLPVTARTLVAGKFGAAMVVNVAGALQWSLAVLLLLRDTAVSLDPLAVAAGTFFWGWLALVTGSSVSTALLARFEVQALASGPVPAAVLVLLGATWLLERSPAGTWDDLAPVLGRPWLPLAAAGIGLLGSVLVTAFAFRVASSAIRGAGGGFHADGR